LWEPKIATLVNVHEHGRTQALVAVGCNRIGKVSTYISALSRAGTISRTIISNAPRLDFMVATKFYRSAKKSVCTNWISNWISGTLTLLTIAKIANSTTQSSRMQGADRGQRVAIDGPQIDRLASAAAWAEHVEPRRIGEQRRADRR